jgi:hypothetical protein
MSFSFNPAHGVIIVDAELDGLTGTISIRLILDTGATRGGPFHVRLVRSA